MSSKHLSIRIESDTLDRLDQQSRRAGQSRSELAKMLLEEGLRMELHPGIVFRSGPAGRRPGLAGGPDVWEVIRVFRSQQYAGEEAIRQAAGLTSLTAEQIRTVIGYYADFKDEIDVWIRRIDDEAERLEAAWQRGQAILNQ